jgi:hypothetical protein
LLFQATELTVQSERAFQKQPHIFLNHKPTGGKQKRVGKGGRRWYKDVGLGFRTPQTAISGSYIGTLENWRILKETVVLQYQFLSHAQAESVGQKPAIAAASFSSGFKWWNGH